ncbi:hypothetical protein M422DRAFT_40543 [Sphaerobolus stellatus SS14]|nr:hypothetical protein M422DRAFT_40543 [Sphaerobolus stellatus SS14]
MRGVSLFLSFGVLLCVPGILAQFQPPIPDEYPVLPSLRKQAEILDGWTTKRVQNVPEIMKKNGVDVWLMSQREYAEDTVFWSVKPAVSFAARRRTVYLFHTNTTSAVPNPIVWIDNTPSVWSSLRDTLTSLNPTAIALNIDPDFAFADGLHAGELERIKEQLGEEWMKKTVRRPMLAIEFVARRIDEQLEYYKMLMGMAWRMVNEAFSERTVEVGVTTAEDLSWWFRDQMQALNLSTWFMTGVSIIRAPSADSEPPTSSSVIIEGDMLHVDFGFTLLGLNTDTQHLGYVLRASEGETDVPEGLKEGLRKSNRMQEIVRANMEPGKTGNDVLTECLKNMDEESIEGKVYSHPIGDRGHAAGSLIGMTNLPHNVPVLGDIPILPKTYYSVELLARHFVPEWNTTVEFMQEEDVHWSDETQGWEWVFGRQEKFHLVRPPTATGHKLKTQANNAAFLKVQN